MTKDQNLETCRAQIKRLQGELKLINKENALLHDKLYKNNPEVQVTCLRRHEPMHPNAQYQLYLMRYLCMGSGFTFSYYYNGSFSMPTLEKFTALCFHSHRDNFIIFSFIQGDATAMSQVSLCSQDFDNCSQVNTSFYQKLSKIFLIFN